MSELPENVKNAQEEYEFAVQKFQDVTLEYSHMKQQMEAQIASAQYEVNVARARYKKECDIQKALNVATQLVETGARCMLVDKIGFYEKAKHSVMDISFSIQTFTYPLVVSSIGIEGGISSHDIIGLKPPEDGKKLSIVKKRGARNFGSPKQISFMEKDIHSMLCKELEGKSVFPRSMRFYTEDYVTIGDDTYVILVNHRTYEAYLCFDVAVRCGRLRK